MDTRPTPSDLSRRNVLRGAALGTAAVPVLVACGGDSDGSKTNGNGLDLAAGTVLAQTADVAMGAAVFLDEPSVVVTQPSSGTFVAFDRTCTHAQCAVTDIRDGKIHCKCHDSLYDLSTGENVGGPAPAPLTKVDIKVAGADIVVA